jgi:LmbE family N-acetylglucosaminyl deacetylase
MSRALVLSPHPDDAVLSLWHVLSGPGEVAVVNVFAGLPPPGPLGWWDELTGAVDPLARAGERAEEDREALALAGRKAIALDFVDAQYRREPQPVEPIVAQTEALAEPEALILAPAALGAHPDHRLVLDAALTLADRGREVALYADVPHGHREGWPAWVTGSGEGDGDVDAAWREHLVAAGVPIDRLEPEVHRLDPEQDARKREAVAAYRTQVGILESHFALFTRLDLLRYELVWRFAPVPARD